MTFSRITWVNGPGGGTKLNATNLNRIETGIYDSHYNALITADANANIAATVRGFSASQSGDLLRVQKQSDSDTYLRVSSAGIVSVEKTGKLRLLNGTAFTSTQDPTYETAVGTTVFDIDDTGNVKIGPSELVDLASVNEQIPDFLYHAKTRRIWTRSMFLSEIGDPVDFAIQRAGGDYPAGTPVGTLSGEAFGTIYWRGWTTPDGGTPGVTTGGAFEAQSAAIYARAAENIFDTEAGGHIFVATTPVGTAAVVDRIVVSAVGSVGVLASGLAASTVQAANRGDLYVGSALRVYGNLGFYGATPVAKPTVSGSRGGNAALADLLTELATMGLITDSTS